MEQLTPAQKAAQTRAERTERKELEDAARKNDRIRAIEICRQIRDDESASNADRLSAISLLRTLT